MLAIVWAVEHFKNYVCVQFKTLSDHKALITVLRPNRGNKTFSTWLTRWIDRLFPFEFEVVHVAGSTLSVADYLSRHPTELKGASIKAETLWNEWFTVNSINSLNDVLENKEATSDRSNPEKSASQTNCVNSIKQVRRKQPSRMQD